MNRNFSVLMSLYKKEKAEYLRACLESLEGQTVKASEWVIVEDGPLTEELYLVLNEYEAKYPGLIKRVVFAENRGLGLALRDGVLSCSYDIIARMDTDDIARKDRFEKQLEAFETDLDLDICGSHIIEFEGDICNKISERKVPLEHNDIAKYQKQRSAFNHMTVMYKKQSVLRAGNYEHCPLMEDDMLWVRMLISGIKSRNIDDFLVYARTGYSMIERRGGYQYFKKYKFGRRMIKKTGYISNWDYFKSVFVQFIVALLPRKIRLFIFVKLLRKD